MGDDSLLRQVPQHLEYVALDDLARRPELAREALGDRVDAGFAVAELQDPHSDLVRHQHVRRRDVGVVERIELGPEHVAFEFERGEHGLLLIRPARFALYVVECEIGVARRLSQARIEIGERVAADEGVIRQHARDALADDARREQLSERRRHCLKQRALAHEAHIGLDRELGRGQGAAGRDDIVPIKSEAVSQREPPRDAALAGRAAVVIHQALSPQPPELGIRSARDQRRILARDRALIAIAIERPSLDLALGEPAAVEQPMERVQIVIALRADAPERRFELGRRQHLAHGLSSIPSWAIVQPARSASARSGESSSRTGFVLLIWMKTFRLTPRSRKAAMTPSSPDMLRCPMRLPVFVPTPSRIISSSRQSVPSKNTSGAPRSRSSRDVVMAAHPGTKKNRAPLRRSATSSPIVLPFSARPGSRPSGSSQSATFPGTAKPRTDNPLSVPFGAVKSTHASRGRMCRSTQSGDSTRKIGLAEMTLSTSAVA